MEIAVLNHIEDAKVADVTATAIEGSIGADANELPALRVAVVKDAKNMTITGSNLIGVGGDIHPPDVLQTTRRYGSGPQRQSRAASRKGGNIKRYESNTPYPIRNSGKKLSRGNARPIGRKSHRWGLKKVPISKEALPAPKVLEADGSTPAIQD
ncbi:hypothetical protein C0989_008465 [Termitomyces sp. Mn162]|nr:hypothetical protein C0989_008465 [Termitomyces sp. Mn162]